MLPHALVCNGPILWGVAAPDPWCFLWTVIGDMWGFDRVGEGIEGVVTRRKIRIQLCAATIIGGSHVQGMFIGRMHIWSGKYKCSVTVSVFHTDRRGMSRHGKQYCNGG